MTGRDSQPPQDIRFRRDRNKKPQLMLTHKFPRAGKFHVACRVQDSRGGEGMWIGEVEVK